MLWFVVLPILITFKLKFLIYTQVDYIYADLSKVFDKISHNFLPEWFAGLGVCGSFYDGWNHL